MSVQENYLLLELEETERTTPLDSLEEEYSKEPPKLIVVTKASELIVTEGKLAYEPIKGTSLLFVTNTENDIILDINTQIHYVLLNGRWYGTSSLADANWEFVEPEQLPDEFSSIPADGTSISSVRVSVPGTDESKEAIYEQYIPQTAKVDRNTATTSVEYDGEPQFDQIEGTDMLYAKNTASTVLLIDSTFYAIDEFLSVLNILAPFHQSSEPIHPLLIMIVLSAPFFIQPMRRNPIFRILMHFGGSDLDFKRFSV